MQMALFPLFNSLWSACKQVIKSVNFYCLGLFSLFFTLSLFGFSSSRETFPRFATLKSDKVNVRAGPSESFPLKGVYRAKDLPIKLREQYNGWCFVEDAHGQTGWVRANMLGRKKRVLFLKDTVIVQSALEGSAIKARVKRDVIVAFEKCKQGFCLVSFPDHKVKGWASEDALWGVDPS